MSKARHFDTDHTFNIPPMPIAPEAPTYWDAVLAELKATEAQALKVIKRPRTPEERKLRSDLEKKLRGKRDRYFIPDAAVDAFGWREQQESKFA